MLSSASSAFDRLPPRPPTPPRETSQAIDDAIAFLDDSNDLDRLLTRSKLHEGPADTVVTDRPLSSQGTAHAVTGIKKVGFDLDPVTIDSDISGQDSSPSAPTAGRSSAVKHAKPVRSILKLTHPSLPPTPDSLRSKLAQFSPDIPGSFAKMLQSIIQQLAGSSRVSRLDAYLALNGVLKTYAGVPDVHAMASRMELFMQFLSRDISWQDPEGNPDVNIITQALKLAATIMGTTALAEHLDADFKACLVDRSISVFEQSDMPKAVVKAHLVVAAQSRFHSNMLSMGRADRLLAALRTLEERCSGNGLIAARLTIYLRMIEQSPSLMLTKISDWIEHIFHGMLSSITDIRCRAIDTCTEAGLAFGQQPSAAKALHAMLVTEVEDGQTYFDFLIVRLIELISDPEVGPCIPQVWSAVILFFRSKRMPLAKWPKLKSWLTVIQRCLNSGDPLIRHQATLAWNKMVFAIMPDASTDSNLMSMLKVPIIPGLSKRGADKHAQQSRHHALESYCNLLHYCLRPGLSKEDLDVAWKVHVHPVLPELARSGSKGRHTACRILEGMLTGNTGIWNPSVALEQLSVGPAQLPRLDPRWVRSHLGKIMTVIEPILATGMHLPPEANIALDDAWSALMRSIADAGSQEVKTSQELKEAIAQLVNVLRKLWIGRDKLSQTYSETRWLERYVSLTESVVTTLGASPFAEDILAPSRDDDTVEVAPTPSQKHTKQNAHPQSPMMILLHQFVSPVHAFDFDEACMGAIRALLKQLISARSTPGGKLALLDRCLQLLLPVPEDETAMHARSLFWTSIASIVTVILTSGGLKSTSEQPENAGFSLRLAFNVLATGLTFPNEFLPYNGLEDLYASIDVAATAIGGEGGVVVALAEPFSKALAGDGQSISLSNKLRLGRYVLQQVVWPKNRQSLDSAWKSLWGTSLAGNKTTVFDPFEHLYALINDITGRTYQVLGTDEACNFSSAQGFLFATIDFLDRSPLSLLGIAFRKVQPGLSMWIQDELRKTGVDAEVSQTVYDLWTRVGRLLKKMPNKGTDLLKFVDMTIVAGMSSPHRAVVNDCIIFWNDTFGKEKSLEYPCGLEKILRARAIDAELILPTFPESDASSDLVELSAFFETQSQSPVQTIAKSSGNLPKGTNFAGPSLASFKNTWLTDQQRSPLRQLSNSSSPARRAARKSASVTPKPKLRHDNSQIQFAPIENSPLPSVDESQLLTEHQKEVKTRQHDNAHIFSDFSSSPTAQSTALPKGVSKRLDFKSNAQQLDHDDVQVTPSALLDGNGLMSDDLPSSPTPSSARDARHEPLGDDDDTGMNEANEDLPSSPPQTTRQPALAPRDTTMQDDILGPDNTTVDVTHFAAHNDNTAAMTSIESAPDKPTELESDLASDSILPTIQLQQEEEEASVRQSQDNGNMEYELITASDNERSGPESNSVRTQSDAGAEDEDVSRIKNSFIQPVEDAAEEDTRASGGSEHRERPGKKRKRSTTSTWSSKKRKQVSPLKRLTTYLLGQSQEEDDDDMGDEIVVASSQRSSSAVPQTAAEMSPGIKPEPVAEPMSVMLEEQATETLMQPPKKRSRGRPRKSENTAPTPSEPINSLKRKASVLSSSSVPEEEANAGAMEEAAGIEMDSQRGMARKRTTRKTATAVVVSNNELHFTDAQVERDVSLHGGPLQVTDGTVSVPKQDEVARASPVAAARGILGRLHEVLADMGETILGRQEEREFDDVLFEIRQKVHEAARRGREQGDGEVCG